MSVRLTTIIYFILYTGLLTAIPLSIIANPQSLQMQAPLKQDNAKKQKILLILGDSLSAGYGFNSKQSWVTLLERRLEDMQSEYQVINASISGDTTGNGLARLPHALDTYHPHIVIIALGGNDGLRGLPVDTIRNNLAYMITLSHRHGARVLLIGVRLPPNYGPTYTQQFSALYQQLAKTYQVPLIPKLLKGIAGTKGNGLMQVDGIHPTEKAQTQLLENIWPKLKEML